MRTKLSSAFIAILFMAAFASSASASGFAIIEHSVSGLGNSFAGVAASAEDATTVFFNPAGMTLLEGQQVTAGAHVILPSAEFTAETAENALGMNISGGNGGDGGQNAFVPNLYYTNKLNNQWSVGLGINAPFGLATEYDKDWVGRYHAVESDVMTLNINPSVAYRINEKLSIGAGLNIQYIDATLSSMSDYGLGVASSLLENAANPATPPNVAQALSEKASELASNPNADIFANIEADDWSYGFNLGLLYALTPTSRIGLSYRSEVQHDLKGDVKFQVQNAEYLEAVSAQLLPFGVPNLLQTAQASFPNQGASGGIDLPAVASLSLYHEISPAFAILADISWTQWSSFDELVINFDGTLQNDPSATTENWDDTWRYSLGATYQASEALKLRTGIAYDETPIPDAYRTPRIPGEDRIWLSLGAGYQFTESLSMDVAYAHLFVDDSKMEKTATPGTEDEGRGTVIGEFENSVDIASLQLSYSF